MKVDLGCGNSPLDGFYSVDIAPGDGVDLVTDLDRPDPWRFELAGVTEWHASHLVEHIRHPLNLLEAMWFASEPGACAVFRCPYGSSDDAWEDPTHVRPYFAGSWNYFGQPHYWRVNGSYGYRGDWAVEEVSLTVPAEILDRHVDLDSFDVTLRHERNIVSEMVVSLVACKPRRSAVKENQRPLNLVIAAEAR